MAKHAAFLNEIVRYREVRQLAEGEIVDKNKTLVFYDDRKVPHVLTGVIVTSTSILGCEAMFETGRTSFDGAGKEPGIIGKHPKKLLMNYLGDIREVSVPAISVLTDGTISPSWLDPMPEEQPRQQQKKQGKQKAQPERRHGANVGEAIIAAQAKLLHDQSSAPAVMAVAGEPLPAEVKEEAAA